MPDQLTCQRCHTDVEPREPHTTIVRQTERHARWSGPHVLDAVLLAVLCDDCAQSVTVDLVPLPVQLVCPVDGCAFAEVVPGGTDPAPVLLDHIRTHNQRALAAALVAATPWTPVRDPAPAAEPIAQEATTDA